MDRRGNVVQELRQDVINQARLTLLKARGEPCKGKVVWGRREKRDGADRGETEGG